MNKGFSLKSFIARSLGLTDPRLSGFLSSGPTYAGEQVSVASAMQLDVVWACVRLISQTIATLPLFLYERDAKGFGAINTSHQLYRILHGRPNADMTAVNFWEAMVASILLWGNAYAAIERLGNRIVAIRPLRPDRVTVQFDRLNGVLVYHYSYMGEISTFSEDDIFHVMGFSLDGLVGISPIEQARQCIASATAAEKSAGAFFKNGMRPSAVMKAPTYLTDPQREQAKTIIEKFSGSMATGGVPLLEGGWLIEQMSLKPEDAQLIQTRSFQVEQLCRWFDVPPPMIGHMDKSTAWGTGLEQMMQWFLTFSLRPHLKRIEQAIHKSLLTPKEQLSFYAEFNVEGLMRADSAGRAALYTALVDHGLRTPNELRALDNEPPLPNGDDLMVNSAMLPIGLLGEAVRGKQAPPKPNINTAPEPKENIDAPV